MLRWGSNTLLNPAKLSLWYFTVSIELWTNLRGINTSKLIQYPSVFFIGLVIESLNNKTDLLTIYHFFSFICPLCSGVTSVSLVVSSNYCLFTVNIIRRVLHCLLICFLHWWVMSDDFCSGWSWRTTWNIRGTWSFSGAIFCFLQGIHNYRII